MNESPFAPLGTKVYRLKWFWRLYHFAFGAAFMIGAIRLGTVRQHLLMIGLVVVSLIMIARPFIMAVTVDRLSVTFKGTFSVRRLQRLSITAVETKHTGRGNLLILWGNIDKKEKLVIPDLFDFDDA